MHADLVQISWDAAKSQWLVRIESGEEVIRRHCREPKNADDQKLRSVAQEVIQDEGYDADPAQVRILR